MGGDDLYLKINNLQYNAFSKDELFDIKVKNGKTRKYDFDKNYKYYQPINEFNINVEYGDLSFGKGFTDARTSPYSGGNNDLLLNLNDYQDDNTEIKIIFDNTGHYSYDSIELFELNYDSMEDDVNNLNRSNFKIEDYQQGYMKALVNFETNGILQFSTTYSDGWDIYIDGKKANSLKANKYFLGCYVSKGNHVVELKYHTPYLKLGIIISLISLISLCVIIIFEKKSGNKYEKKDGIKK